MAGHAHGRHRVLAARTSRGAVTWTPAQISSFYGIDYLTSAGLTGKGNRSRWSSSRRAWQGHDEFLELLRPSQTRCRSYRSTAARHRSAARGSRRDIQEAAAQAPGATILSVRSARQPGAAEYDVYNTMVSQDKAQVVSTSWATANRRLVRRRFHERVGDGVPTGGRAGAKRVRGRAVTLVGRLLGDEARSRRRRDHPGQRPFVTAGGTSLMQSGKERLERMRGCDRHSSGERRRCGR